MVHCISTQLYKLEQLIKELIMKSYIQGMITGGVLVFAMFVLMSSKGLNGLTDFQLSTKQ
jgi:hypothetical protein